MYFLSFQFLFTQFVFLWVFEVMFSINPISLFQIYRKKMRIRTIVKPKSARVYCIGLHTTESVVISIVILDSQRSIKIIINALD